MSRLGVDRNPRSGRHQVDPTGELSAPCYEELLRLDQRVGPKSEPSTPNSENRAHEKAPFRDFQTPALPVAPPARDDLSSLNCVSFLNIEIYKPRLRQGRFNEPQTLVISPLTRAFVHPEPHRFIKSSVGNEIAMSSDHERSVVMRC